MCHLVARVMYPCKLDLELNPLVHNLFWVKRHSFNGLELYNVTGHHCRVNEQQTCLPYWNKGIRVKTEMSLFPVRLDA